MIHTANEIIKVTFSIPKHIIEDLKHNTENMSRYVSEAIAEKRAYEKRIKAIEELRKLGPAFPEIEDASAWVQELREGDLERDKRLGLL